MRELLTRIVFLGAAGGFALAWGRSLWYFDERSSLVRRWTFRLLNYTRRPAGEVRTLFLSGIYYGLGLLAALAFALAFRLRAGHLFSWSRVQLSLTMLGIVAEISLTNLLVALGCAAMGGVTPDRFSEIRQVPWMKGLQELPAAAVPVAAALGGIVEETVFRGVLLQILTQRLAVAPLAAVFVVGGLFCYQQAVQLRTRFQVLVIGSGCVAISLVGGLLVSLTGSVVPAIVCHGSFVLFFLNQGRSAAPDARRRGPRPGRVEPAR